MRQTLILITACVLASVPTGSPWARTPERVDAFASSPTAKALLPEAATSALVRAGSKTEIEPRLGVPTFLWAAQRPVPAGVLLPEQAARHYLAEFAPLYRLAAEDAASASVVDVHDTGRGAVIVTFKESVEGIEVFRESLKVALRRDLSLHTLSGYLSGAPARAGRNLAAAYRLNEREAIAAAFAAMTGDQLASSKLKGTRIKKVLFHLPDRFVPSYYVELSLDDSSGADGAMNSFVVSAADGAILFRNNLTVSDAFTYRVWAENATPFRPFDGPQGNGGSPHPTGVPNGYQAPFLAPGLVTLQNGPISTNDPWLPSGATVSTGNNVDAYADLASPDGFGAGDMRATTTSAGVFDRTYDTTQAPGASSNQIMAAITQLFFDVNFLHDWYYDSGFTESAGNAQASNYGRGGVEGDPLHAEAQDYGGTNNANMSTPSDGGSPRMQMYLWTPRTPHTVTVTPPFATYGNGVASYGPQAFDVTGNVILAADGTAPATDACQPITNVVTGRIVLIDRGLCTFKQKAVNAQAAGAIGVILVNDAAGNPPGMPDGAPAGTVTIPMLSLSQTDGNSIKSSLMSGAVIARLYREAGVYRDGTIENTVVAHEWGHYISNRLIGDGNGLGNTQGGGMGEGWGDFTALLMIVRPEDTAIPANTTFNDAYAMASYAVGGAASSGIGTNEAYYFGIRRYPYSTDMNKNPLTFRHITTGVALPVGPPVNGGGNNAEVHNTGEVWANMLWECYAAILRDTLGPSPRLTFNEAQRRMRDYLVAGYKLTPADPTFVEARDALLAAIGVGDLTDYTECSQAFARRGLGLRAVAPDRYSTDNSGLVESFTSGNDLELVSITLGDGATSCDADGVLDAAETGLLTITLRNIGTGALAATSATVGSIHPSITFPSGTALAFPASQPRQTTTASIPLRLGLTSGIQQADVTVAYRDAAFTIPGDRTGGASFRVNSDELAASSKTDTVEANGSPWTAGGNPAFNATAGWRRTAATPLDHRFLGPDPGAGPTDQFLVSPSLAVSAVGSFSFTFRHRYAFEYNTTPTYYDGGVIELSTDGGANWTDIGASASPGYNGPISTCCSNPLQTRLAYVQTNASYPAFETVTVNLGTAYQGATVKLRFRVGSDEASGGAGWEIDDLVFTGIDNTPFPQLIADRGFCLHPGDVVLQVKRNGGNPSLVDFSWNPSCGNDVGGYAVYDGSLGSYYTEVPINCSVAGTTLNGQTTGAGSRYFLVAPLSALSSEEGSHGLRSSGPRPPSASVCRPVLDTAACN